MPINGMVEGHAILKPRIHSLSVKRHNGMGRITHEKPGSSTMPIPATDRSQTPGWICEEIRSETVDERYGIGKLLLKE